MNLTEKEVTDFQNAEIGHIYDRECNDSNSYDTKGDNLDETDFDDCVDPNATVLLMK